MTYFHFRPGHDLEDTPSNLLSFLVDDETSGGMRWTLVLIICSLTLLVVVNKTIHKASIQNTLLRAKNITTAVVAGDKKIDRSA